MGVTFGFNLRITSKLIDGIKVSYHEIQRNGKRSLWHTLPSPHQFPTRPLIPVLDLKILGF